MHDYEWGCHTLATDGGGEALRGEPMRGGVGTGAAGSAAGVVGCHGRPPILDLVMSRSDKAAPASPGWDVWLWADDPD